jgi:hypothetical protein
MEWDKCRHTVKPTRVIRLLVGLLLPGLPYLCYKSCHKDANHATLWLWLIQKKLHVEPTLVPRKRARVVHAGARTRRAAKTI